MTSKTFTEAGKYRGGKTYDSNKKYIILSGQCGITTHQWWEDVIQKV